MLIKFYCLNRIIPRLEKPETYSILIVDCGLCPQYLHTSARNVAISSYSVPKGFKKKCVGHNICSLIARVEYKVPVLTSPLV
jgi:hypothetical protein